MRCDTNIGLAPTSIIKTTFSFITFITFNKDLALSSVSRDQFLLLLDEKLLLVVSSSASVRAKADHCISGGKFLLNMNPQQKVLDVVQKIQRRRYDTRYKLPESKQCCNTRPQRCFKLPHNKNLPQQKSFRNAGLTWRESRSREVLGYRMIRK